MKLKPEKIDHVGSRTFSVNGGNVKGCEGEDDKDNYWFCISDNIFETYHLGDW